MSDLAYKKALTEYLEGFVSERRKGRLHEVLEERTNHMTLVLEDVYQTHNFSAVLRSADIFGIQTTSFIENRNKYKISEDVSMGSTQWLTLNRYQNFENNTKACLSDLKGKGYRIVATSLHKNSISLEDLDVSKPFALVFGTELTGITKDVEDMADDFVKLPMYGFTESFNISVCAALCMYNLSTKIRKEVPHYGLTEDEKRDIYIDWLKASIRKHDLIIKEFDLKYFEEIKVSK
ncbi:MAG: RNA methyltransferase [Bacteroidetes bacterium]|nr:RNA methyltransferase [Bacteroidota bacterium]